MLRNKAAESTRSDQDAKNSQELEKLLAATKNEIDQRLEQLRALENGMKIHVGYTSFSPLSIDTEEDLKNVQELMKNEKK